MMSKELLKKAGVVGIAFGLLASPMAFADTTDHPSIDENQDITTDDQPFDEGQNVNMNTNDRPDYTQEELTTDHHTQGTNSQTIGEPDSTGHTAGESAETSPEAVVEKNSES
ncbi:hypothetical protein [Vreelandella sp. EE22]